MPGQRCAASPDCDGRVEEGYCGVCGRRALPPPGPAADPRVRPPGTPSTVPTPAGATAAASALGTGGASSIRERLGIGLCNVPPIPVVDPVAALMESPRVVEDRRFCSRCHAEVGRSRSGRPGRTSGFCGKCRHPFSFLPVLAPGDVVAGQYRIRGCLAYGGLGWIYLAYDLPLDRWVVLKGVLRADDLEAIAAAVAERQFLARVVHPNVVRIHNVVEHAGAGYIVMEYIGGKTLKSILKERQRANGGQPDPLPVEHAITYVLGILPAFAHLHRLGLVYNDFKPDNVMVEGEDVKLIDLGAVTRIGDKDAPVYGTDGYQAPEVCEMGPSVTSDLYTIARSLAVLMLDFRGYQTRNRYSLPPEQHPLLAQHESLHRLLRRGTAPRPRDRFQSADEMADQLLGVLREVAAADGIPRPAISNLFAAGPRADRADADPSWRHLPAPKLDPNDPGAGMVVNAGAIGDPADRVAFIHEALVQGQAAETTEVRLALAGALIELGRHQEAGSHLRQVEEHDEGTWRAWWYTGLSLLAQERPAEAKREFERVSDHLPGELVPKLAVGLAAELSGDLPTAARLYDAVSRTDPGFTTAVFGLARVRVLSGDRAGAVEAYERVPDTSSAHVAARVAQARMLVAPDDGSGPTLAALERASATVERLAHALDPRREAELRISILDAALGRLTSGMLAADGGRFLLDCPLEEIWVRRGLESGYRRLARLSTGEEKVRLVDLANRVRPMTAV